MIQKIKELRVQIDGLAQLTKKLKPIAVHSDLEKSFTEFLVYGEQHVKVSFLNSKEINKAVDSLYLAKAWLGKVLSELGNENPYKSGYKTRKDIEPTADTAKIVHGMREPYGKEPAGHYVDTWELNGRPMNDYDNFNHIEKVDWLRTEIEKCTSKVRAYYLDVFGLTEAELEINYLRNSLLHLSEARFWLGFELERIKNDTA